MSESDSAGSVRLCVKEVTIWEYVEIEKHICPILHNHINLGNNKLYYLLDYGNKYTENQKCILLNYSTVPVMLLRHCLTKVSL